MRRRLDLVFVPMVEQKTGRHVEVPYPDPRRYEWREANGKRYLYDRLDDALMPEALFLETVNSLASLPAYDQQPKIKDATAYVEGRRETIRRKLIGQRGDATYMSPSEEFLRALPNDTHDFVILSLDLVGSTRRATGTMLNDYARTMQAVLGEIGEVLPLFHGHVLKHTGDGVIAYFASPGFITKHDLAIDCALTLRKLIYSGFNPMLRELGWRELDIRIGLDSGKIAVVPIGSAATKQEKDLIGEVVSIACKIQSRAPTGGITLGDEMLRNLHTQWREICEELPLPSDWSFQDPHFGRPYAVHLVKAHDWRDAAHEADVKAQP